MVNMAVCMYSLCISCMAINIFPVLRSVEYFNANVYSVAEERRQLSVEYVAQGVDWNVAMLSRSLFWSVWDEVLPIVVPDKQSVLMLTDLASVASVKPQLFLLCLPGSKSYAFLNSLFTRKKVPCILVCLKKKVNGPNCRLWFPLQCSFCPVV